MRAITISLGTRLDRPTRRSIIVSRPLQAKTLTSPVQVATLFTVQFGTATERIDSKQPVARRSPPDNITPKFMCITLFTTAERVFVLFVIPHRGCMVIG